MPLLCSGRSTASRRVERRVEAQSHCSHYNDNDACCNNHEHDDKHNHHHEHNDIIPANDHRNNDTCTNARANIQPDHAARAPWFGGES